jgi:hypothetical protein
MADPYKNNVVLYLPMEGSRHGDTVILDRTGKTVTRNGDVILSTTVAPPFGTTSAYFDGNGDTLQIADSALPELGTDSFTIECWAYFGVLDSTHRYCLTKRNTASGYYSPVMLGTNASNQLRFCAAATDNSGYAVDMTGPTLTVSVWTHLAVTRDGSTWRLFKDGVLVASATSSHSVYDNADDFAIGCGAYGGDAGSRFYFSGYIKDLRITKGVARYTGNFSPSQTTTVADDYWANVVLAVHGEGTGTTFTDVSNDVRTITTNGNITHSTGVSPPFGYSSIYFDGAGYLSLANSASFNPNGTITIECWVYVINLSVTRRVLTIDGSAGTHIGHPLTIEMDGSVNFIVTKDSNNLNYTFISSVVGAVSANTWVHIAIVKQGLNGKIYINGVDRTSTGAFSEEAEPNIVGSYLKIGVYHDNGGGFFGYIKDLRITKGVARYTQNFNPWRVQDPYYKDSVLIISGEGTGTTFTDGSPAKNAITLYYDTTHSTAVNPPFGSSSIYFDGTQDWLSVPKSSHFDFGSRDFTIEMWVYLTQYAGTSYVRSIWSTGKTTASDYYSTRISVSDTNKLYCTFSTNGTSQTSLPDIEDFPLNTWVHVAMVRYNNNITLYKNGSVVNSSSVSGSIYYSTTDPVSIAQDHSFGGTGYDNRWKGYMKNIVVINGSAKYKSTFTPAKVPTQTRSNGAPAAFPDKTAIKTIATPVDWDNPELMRIIL